MILAVLLVIVIGNVSNAIQNLVSGFAWTFFGAAMKMVVLSIFYEKLLYCPKCEATRWAVSYKDKWYCPRCGTKRPVGINNDEPAQSSAAAAQAKGGNSGNTGR